MERVATAGLVPVSVCARQLVGTSACWGRGMYSLRNNALKQTRQKGGQEQPLQGHQQLHLLTTAVNKFG